MGIMSRPGWVTRGTASLACLLALAGCRTAGPETDLSLDAGPADPDITTTSATLATLEDPSVTETTIDPSLAEASTTTAPFLDPADIEVDTDGCPAEAEADGPIRIGVNGGGFNGSAHIEGLQAAIDDANETGGIDGRSIELVTAIERQSDFNEAITHIDALLDRGDLHAIVPWSGWPDPNLVADRFADACVPALFWIDSAAPDAPWIIPGLADRRAEMAVIAEWLASEVRPSHVLLAPVEWPSSLSFGESLRASLEDRGVERITTSPVQVNPNVEFRTDATDVDAIVLPTPGGQCVMAVEQAKRQFPDAVIVVSHQCTGFDPSDDEILHGVHRLRLFPGRTPAPFDNGFSGYLAAEATGRAVVAALDTASSLDGGPTRANILRAASALTIAILPLNPDPAAEPDAAMVINTRGPNDRFPLESAAVEVFELTPGDGGRTGWNLLGAVVRAEGTTPMTEIDWSVPVVEEPELPCISPSGEPEVFTFHWFGEEGELDPQADIALYVGHVDLGPDPEVVLIATGADGVEERLTMAAGRGGVDCPGELFFDIALGEAGRIAGLEPPVAIRFEAGPLQTGSVSWPDDFPLAPPFGNVPVPLESD